MALTGGSPANLHQESPGRLFLRLYRDFQLRCDPKLASRGYSDISEAHLNVLTHVEVGGTRLVTLAEKTNMTKQSMAHLVSDLVACGYLERSADTSDKRASLLRCSSRGQSFLNDLNAIREEIIAEYQGILGKMGASTFFENVIKILTP